MDTGTLVLAILLVIAVVILLVVFGLAAVSGKFRDIDTWRDTFKKKGK